MAIKRIQFPNAPSGTVDKHQRSQIAAGIDAFIVMPIKRIQFPNAPSGLIDNHQRSQIGMGLDNIFVTVFIAKILVNANGKIMRRISTQGILVTQE